MEEAWTLAAQRHGGEGDYGAERSRMQHCGTARTCLTACDVRYYYHRFSRHHLIAAVAAAVVTLWRLKHPVRGAEDDGAPTSSSSDHRRMIRRHGEPSLLFGRRVDHAATVVRRGVDDSKDPMYLIFIRRACRLSFADGNIDTSWIPKPNHLISLANSPRTADHRTSSKAQIKGKLSAANDGDPSGAKSRR